MLFCTIWASSLPEASALSESSAPGGSEFISCCSWAGFCMAPAAVLTALSRSAGAIWETSGVNRDTRLEGMPFRKSGPPN